MRKLGREIKNLQELMENLSQVDLYLSEDDGVNYEKMLGLISRGTVLVAYKSGSEMRFAPSRFLGYLKNNLIKHLVKNNGKDGRDTTRAINGVLGITARFDEKMEKKYLEFCRKYGVKPKDMVHTQRKYWILDREQNQDYSQEFSEGDVQKSLVNKYERNPAARKACIDAHGCYCEVCNLNFEERYGELGKDFIHVHHVVPVSERGGKGYKIDPEKDLVPVCPNCHAMLHKGNLTVEQLKKVVKGKGKF